MIDPSAVTRLARTESELEEFLLFCVVVAGKNADQQARKLEDFLGGAAPFPFIRSLRGGELERRLKRVKLGKYALLGESFRRMARAGVDLRSCAWERLLAFPGVGIKTAKFFVLHSRPRQMHGVLDTHILSWMRQHPAFTGRLGLKIPRHSPQDAAAYRFWETVYFGMILARHHQASPGPDKPIDWARVDLDLWKERRAM
jgi:hypothetical protein